MFAGAPSYDLLQSLYPDNKVGEGSVKDDAQQTLGQHRANAFCLLWLLRSQKLYSAKRSDVTGNRFEWELGENKVIWDLLPQTSLY